MPRLTLLNHQTLGKSALLKLRKEYKLQNNLPANTSEKNLLNFGFFENKKELYHALVEQHNDKITAQITDRNTERRTQRNTKSRQKYSVKKSYKKITKFIHSKRYIIQPNESAFNRYNKYTIPAWASESFQYSMTEHDSKPIRMDIGLLTDCLHNLNQYIYPIIKDNLKTFKFIRSFDKMTFLCFNTQQGENYGAFTMERGFKRIDSGNIHEIRQHHFAEAERQMEDINEKDYIYVYAVGEVSLQVLQYNPLTGSSYTPLPKFIVDTKSIINIKNTDHKCFLWSCIASRHPPSTNHAERVNHYEPFVNEFKYDEADMPMKINKISKFEKANNVNINVYMVDNLKDQTKIPIHISKQTNDEVINLFLHNNHYSLIKTYSRFCGGNHEYNCPNCMSSYANTKCFKTHLAMCKDLNANGTRYIMPEKDTVTKFSDHNKQKRLPVVIYADFEASLMKHEDEKKKYITITHRRYTPAIRCG